MENSEAGTSSDAARPSGGEYQVFLSFRGPDTRHGFTDFLYDGLKGIGLRVFRDDEELRVGDVIGGSLLRAINSSIIYIPIFSGTYAVSKWCLRELAHIIDNVSKSEDQKSILPIFFHIKPEDVKLKTPLYSDALLQHEKEFPNEVEAWRAALVMAGKFKGLDVKRDQSQCDQHAAGEFWSFNQKTELLESKLREPLHFVLISLRKSTLDSQVEIVKLLVEEVLGKLEIKQKELPRHLVRLDDQMKAKVEALDLDGLDDSIEITNQDFKRLQNLKYLKLRDGTFAGDFEKCCSKLRWISWRCPHQDFRADNMYLDHLVVFKLEKNDFTDDSKAWNLIKGAQNLRVISLTECGITTIPDFSNCLRLERLTVACCNKLKTIKSFIGHLQSLIELNIKWCTGLTDLPEEVGALVKLNHFSLQGCFGLRKLPGSVENLTSLRELHLSGTGITRSSLKLVKFPPSLTYLIIAKKMVLKLDLHDDKDKKKALKMVSGFGGVESITMDMKNKKLTVTVTGVINPVEFVGKLGKTFHAELISVEPAREVL